MNSTSPSNSNTNLAQGENLVLLGGGGFALEVICYLLDISSSQYPLNIAGIVDHGDPRFDEVEKILGHSINHWEYFESCDLANAKFVATVGSPVRREKIRHEVATAGAELFTIIHPTAYVAKSAVIGAGSILGPFAFVGPMATLGENTVLNTYASVGHNAEVGPSSNLSPYAALNGAAKCGRAAFLGSHAIIAPTKILGSNSKLSAGSILTKDTEDNSLAAGNPAKSRVMFHPLPNLDQQQK